MGGVVVPLAYVINLLLWLKLDFGVKTFGIVNQVDYGVISSRRQLFGEVDLTKFEAWKRILSASN